MNLEQLYINELARHHIDDANSTISKAVSQELRPGETVHPNEDGTITISREAVRRFRRWVNWRRVFLGLQEHIRTLDLDPNMMQSIQRRVEELIENETQDNHVTEPQRFLVNILHDTLNQTIVSSRTPIDRQN